MTAAIECRSVSVALGGMDVLREVDLSVGPGEWVGLIGPNGAGKTTLLKAIAGSVPASGTIALLGDDAAHLQRREVARRLALVPQTPELPPGMKVIDYVLLGRTPYVGYLGAEGREDLAVVAEALDAMDLLGFADRNVVTLSGGEAQRAVLARALAQQAPLLLLDEPTAALDVGRQQEALDVVEDLRRERGLSVLSALHDLTLAGQYPDRLELLDRGAIASSGTAGEVLRPDIIREHFGAEVRVVDEGDGVLVVPVRKRRGRGPLPAGADAGIANR